jgi:FkbM family methyltransferase
MRPYYPLSGKWALTQLSTGQPFFVDKDDRHIGIWIILGGVWETCVDDVLCALARPGDCFVDVGANLGYYTIKIGGMVGPEGKVFSFEANPDMFDFLQENVGINGYAGRARVFSAALGDKPGQLTLAFDRSCPGGGAVLLTHEHAPPGLEIRTVPVITLDDSVPAGQVVDLIKIDVEGFEPLVFKGMEQTLARSPNAAIVTEVSFAQWQRFGSPIEMLTRFADGRRLFRIFNDGRLEELSGDALNASLDRDFISYVLMLPRTPERNVQLQRFLDRFQAPAPAVQAPEKPPRRASLLRRVARRLLRMMA